MAVKTYSLTQLIVKIKKWDQRINEEIRQARFVMNGTGLGDDATTFLGKDIEKVNQILVGELTRIDTFIRQRNLMKSALLRINATTMVQVGKETMTIIEAVERKKVIEANKLLLERAKLVMDHSRKAFLKNTEDFNTAITSLGKGSEGKAKNDLDLIEIQIRNYTNKSKPFMLDPNNMTELIQNLSDSISDFEDNVDYVLSTINATTTVELDLGEA